MNIDQFRARPLVVTVKELCPCCNVLKVGVQKREYLELLLNSCEPCFLAEKRNRAATAEEDYYAW